MKGYKVLNSDWSCRDEVYKLGETKTIEGQIKLCERGFHFCLNPADCFSYYSFDPSNIVVEVECEGVSEEKDEDSKRVCSSITIIRQIEWLEVLHLVNIGPNNTGLRNSGHRNSGHRNSGHRNSGDWNSGDWNSGNWNSGNWNSGDWNSGNWNSGNWNSGNWNSGDQNSGHRNSGHRNSGDWNSGHRNSGDWNSGHQNSGDWNSGDRNSGHFNTITPKLMVFNKECELSNEELNGLIPHLEAVIGTIWIPESNMSEEEKVSFPNYKTLGGYLKKYDLPFKEGVKLAWAKQSKFDKERWLKIPNFDADIFLEITGVDVRLDEDLKVHFNQE